MNNDRSGSGTWGNVTVYWDYRSHEGICYFKLCWQHALLIETALQWNPAKAVVRRAFTLRPADQQKARACGDLELQGDQDGVQKIVLKLQLDDGAAQTHVLWPAMQRKKEDRFIPYTIPPTAPDTLHDKLAAAKASQDRRTMAAVAIDYINGDQSFNAPFIADIALLPPPFNALAACHASLGAQHGIDGAALLALVNQQLHRNGPELYRDIHGQCAAEVLDRCWNSVFAQTIVLGDHHRLLDGLSKTIVMIWLLRRRLPLSQQPPEAGQQNWPQPGPGWTPEQLADDLAAKLILPDTVFPLPLICR